MGRSISRRRSPAPHLELLSHGSDLQRVPLAQPSVPPVPPIPPAPPVPPILSVPPVPPIPPAPGAAVPALVPPVPAAPTTPAPPVPPAPSWAEGWLGELQPPTALSAAAAIPN